MIDRRSRRSAVNLTFIAGCSLATILALAALGFIMFSLLRQGLGGLNLHIFTMDTPSAGSVGGLREAIVGSLIMCSLGMVIALFVGVLAGTWLAEYGGRTPYGHLVRFLNDVLLSAPSILIGLFVYLILVAPFHGFSALAGSVALAVLAAPVVTRTTEDILRLQPDALREAGAGLGATKWVTIRDVIWKGAGAGLLTGGLLAFARISGETAPLLFTALGNNALSFNLTKPMGALPLVIYNSANSAYDDLRQLAWAGALLVALAVLSINIIGRVLAARGKSS
jgi:phosphate transport system permease protein